MQLAPLAVPGLPGRLSPDTALGSRPGSFRRRAIARLGIVVMLAVFLVPFEQGESWSTPVTLSEELDGLPVADSGADAVEDAGTFALAGADDEELLSEIVEAPLRFSAIGFRAPHDDATIELRTSTDGESWTNWDPVEFFDDEDGPDADSAEAAAGQAGAHTEPLWVGDASHLQVRTIGVSPEDLEVTLIDSMRLNGGPVEHHREPAGVGSSADASGLNIVSRAQWGANESWTGRVNIASNVHMGVVHHTAHASSATANSYSRAEAPGLVRAFQRYHTQSLGWSDIGYNVLVDRFGTVYEGRKGGFTNGVIGAHASGWNTGSFGVAVIGNFVDQQASPAAIQKLTEVIGVKSAIHGIDPNGWTNRVGNGSWKPTIIGHRDVGQTSCPGRIQGLLPQIRADAAKTAVRFPDVPSNSPHRTAILELADAGVTRGCTANLFCPGDTLTRGQAASFMVRAFELQPRPGSQFRDVPASSTHAETINALAHLGWLEGYDDGTFRPGEQLTRGQLASLLSRSLPAHAGTAPYRPYPDVTPAMAHYEGIMALASHGVRGDCGGGRFCQGDPVKRDSTASFVRQVRDLHGLAASPTADASGDLEDVVER